MPALTKEQRAAKLRKERRDSRGPLEIRNDHDRRSEMRRSQLSQSMVQLASTVGSSSSSSSSSAVHNVNNRINDSDEESAFSEVLSLVIFVLCLISDQYKKCFDE
jgi:hypothetical protein